MEIPCLPHFTAHTEKEVCKTQDLMVSSLISKGGQPSAPAVIKPVALKLENSVTLGEQSTIDEQMPMDLTRVTENLSPRKKQKQFDAERIIMGHELTDLEINLAQQLLKAQFSKLNG